MRDDRAALLAEFAEQVALGAETIRSGIFGW